MNPRYPTLTKRGFLTKRGHDIHPKLIELINEVIAQMPYGLPINAEKRANYARDLYLETYEGKEPANIPSLTNEDEDTMRSFLYECTQGSPLRVISLNFDGNTKPEVYLERYPLFITPELIGYIHFFRRSDDPITHTHPWRTSYSTVLAGSYKEIRTRDITLLGDGKGQKILNRHTGSFGSISNQDLHRVQLEQTPYGERSCWTLFMHYRHWEYGWVQAQTKPIQAKIWDTLLNKGKGEYKDTDAIAHNIMEKGGANKKSWWTMEDGPSANIDRAHIIRSKFGLTKESYL